MNEALQPLDFFLGDWVGRESGAAGEGTCRRTYRVALGGRFIEVRHNSTFEPQEANPEGEVRDELAIFSFDDDRKVVVLREFHPEGFIIKYALTGDDGGLTFESEDVESGPPGIRSRLVLAPDPPDRFLEVFHLASEGHELAEFIRIEWERYGV